MKKSTVEILSQEIYILSHPTNSVKFDPDRLNDTFVMIGSPELQGMIMENIKGSLSIGLVISNFSSSSIRGSDPALTL